MPVRYPAPESATDQRQACNLALLAEALNRTAPTYGPAVVVLDKFVMN